MKVGWMEFEGWVSIIEAQIRLSKEVFVDLYAFPRGGLILGVVLSHRLNLPLRQSIGPHTLLVDDIADTGNTLKGYYQKKAVLVWREGSIVSPEFFGIKIRKEVSWVNFPWEEVLGG